VRLTGCAAARSKAVLHYGRGDFASVRKFDAHVHANVAAPEILEQARADGFELLSINVDYPDFPSMHDQAAAALALVHADPARFHFATTFSMNGWGQPGWASPVNQHIDESVAQGAAVKSGRTSAWKWAVTTGAS
jgi:hypothetical protein